MPLKYLRIQIPGKRRGPRNYEVIIRSVKGRDGVFTWRVHTGHTREIIRLMSAMGFDTSVGPPEVVVQLGQLEGPPTP